MRRIIMTPVKKTTKKAAETTAAKTTTAKKAAETTAEAPKKVVRKTVRKTVAKKAETKTAVYVEFFGKQISTSAIVEQIKNQNSDKKIETLDVYVKPEENAAYYVINGEGSDSYRIDL